MSTEQARIEEFDYDNKVVRYFFWATIIWGLVGLLVGLIVATQMIDWRFNFNISWLTFGRLRPLHTNAVIFAFTCNAIFAGIYYSTPRLLKTPMFSKTMSWVHFWGWQAIIVAAAITLPLGYSQSREYAELIWPIDLAVAAIWVVFAVNFFLTLVNRREKHIYVAIWFYIASILAIAMLHIFNNLQIPASWALSYSVYAGVQDALVQWWYGHNAVGFLLTTPILGMMYYFLPKAANKPVFSYKLSIIHFWGLVFIYIWAGPHHLYYSALPEWVQSLGMVFSIALWAPSWGGMLNGLYTLRGAWHKVREEPVLKFFVAAVTAYGMSTFEGPLLSIKAVNKYSHFTDWTIAHVHVGALGWVGFMAFGMLYWMVPKLWKTNLYSKSLANAHFWIGTVGIVVYALSMWTGGVTQALMWFATDAAGNLVYPDFTETVLAMKPFYILRAVGGLMYFAGALMMTYNIARSVLGVEVIEETRVKAKALVTADALEEAQDELFDKTGRPQPAFFTRIHKLFEGWPLAFSVVVMVMLSIGGLVQIVPMILIQTKAPASIQVQPYTALEIKGRDLYIREGCYNCHSQQVRPILAETKRYGPISKAYEYMYDHPFQWGSKRTGPDLHRVGGKYPDLWHYRHFEDPRSTSPQSLMPAYPWLLENKMDYKNIRSRLKVMKKLGVPYSYAQIDNAKDDLRAQAEEIAQRLSEQGSIPLDQLRDKEVLAMIAYMQRLGLDRLPDDELLGGR